MYKQPSLGFDYDALEPHLDRETLEIHYGKHHAAYCKKFNDAMIGTEFEEKELKDLLVDLNNLSGGVVSAIRNNGGGAWNHSFFWSCLCRESESEEPSGELLDAITSAFGSLDEFKKKFSDAAATQFGSGWAWLVVGEEGLEIMKTNNQDCPLTVGKKPILCIDVWEHAYYLKYKNLRPDFISAFWNVVNWTEVEKKYLE
jgi:Fe-Mn family superoxide dismutase